MFGPAFEPVIFLHPTWIMGIDKSLTDEFPSVDINGRRYHYGRDSTYGQYLVENAEYAKDYWCFDRKEDLLAFLVNLPESASRDWIVRRHPDWDDVTHEKRGEYIQEHQEFLRKLAAEKQQKGEAKCWYNILTFDQAGYYSAFAGRGEWSVCDSITAEVRDVHVSEDGRKESVIELRAEKKYDEPDKKPLTISRDQALKLASCLVQAAMYIDEHAPLLKVENA